jgi:septal ring-binding cell division protein DamX
VQNSGKYAVLVSSNRRQASAQEQVKSLNGKGYYATMAVNKNNRGTWYVVWAGCCVPEKQAKDMALALNRQGLAKEAKAALPR